MKKLLNITKKHLLEFICICAIFVVLVFPIKKILIDKDFYYAVEVPCSMEYEECIQRDCGIEECPPNELSEYKRLLVKASDFDKCSSESCAVECRNNSISCIPEE